MRASNLLIFFLTLLTTGCEQLVSVTNLNNTSSSKDAEPIGILDIPYGKSHPQFSDAKSQESAFGSITMSTPLVSGPLSEVFFDYTTQIEISEQLIIGAYAERTLLSHQDCMNKLSKVALAVKSNFRIDSESGKGSPSLVLKSGTLSIETRCTFNSGSKYPTLRLGIYDPDLAKKVFQRSTAASGH